MPKLVLIFLAFLTLNTLISIAHDHKCGTMSNLQRHIEKDPTILQNIERFKVMLHKGVTTASPSAAAGEIITIPVVVHVIWRRMVENISDAQIRSQIDILNQDYRLRNSDSLMKTHPFWPFIADAKIEFCLASRDPLGNATTGITRTRTDSTSFEGVGSEKHSATGGIDNWNPSQYLNLWVCNLGGSDDNTLGYAAFPFEMHSAPEDDGVVIDYESFGNIGTVQEPNNLGRTATHEVGHWLGLYHIWGDNEPLCGDDEVLDTPRADEANFHCPTFPHDANDSCDTDNNGEMYMNYMDYVDDACMKMFTKGQAFRMQSTLKSERSSLLTSLGCKSTSDVAEDVTINDINIYPNPTTGAFTVNFRNTSPGHTSLSLHTMLGEAIVTLNSVVDTTAQMYIPAAGSGVYYLKIQSGHSTVTQRVIMTK
ncbi:MAG: T9SS type A sorting domain-containing protein [Ignavibacteria bacterium]|nr:T9SS type A sorting domain-containing protein [Ignavibacteria bacterium]